jgi:RNA polymerase sigma-70 factor (ECF subfamily)
VEPIESHLQVFETLRPQLTGLAYRMTGSRTDADDIVRDAWLRWSSADPASVETPRPYLLQIVARLCIDYATSARARREVYVGPWLPEPIADPLAMGLHGDADRVAELADDLSVALLLVLERLSPLERAAFLLHDVFDFSFEDIAGVLGRAPAACRKLASRARHRVAERRPRARPPEAVARAFIDKFHLALQSGDLAAFAKVLAEDAEYVADGGGKAYAALNPIRGRDKIMRFLVGLLAKFGVPREIRYLPLNGCDGYLIVEMDGALQTWSIDWNAEGEVQAIYAMRNPDKLRHLGRMLEGSMI